MGVALERFAEDVLRTCRISILSSTRNAAMHILSHLISRILVQWRMELLRSVHASDPVYRAYGGFSKIFRDFQFPGFPVSGVVKQVAPCAYVYPWGKERS